MQGKDPSEPETRIDCSAGVDVSKQWLDAHVLPADQRLRVPNSKPGIAQLKRWLIRHDVELVAVEPTGKFHRSLCRSLAQGGIPVSQVDPYRARQFAKAAGVLAKTDSIDASVLARFAMAMGASLRTLPGQALYDLQELVRARETAVLEATGLRNQKASANDRFLIAQLNRRIRRLERDIACLEQEIDRRIAADPQLARRREILVSIPGIAAVTATTLVAAMPELGTVSRREVAMLAGLAPIANESGEQKGKRSIRGGRGNVRRVLYMAALSAKRWQPHLRAFEARLKDEGKQAKVVIIAVARKLLVLANSLISQDRIYATNAP